MASRKRLHPKFSRLDTQDPAPTVCVWCESGFWGSWYFFHFLSYTFGWLAVHNNFMHCICPFAAYKSTTLYAFDGTTINLQVEKSFQGNEVDRDGIAWKMRETRKQCWCSHSIIISKPIPLLYPFSGSKNDIGTGLHMIMLWEHYCSYFVPLIFHAMPSLSTSFVWNDSVISPTEILRDFICTMTSF